MSNHGSLHLFEGFGVELEYMIVDAHTLAVKPITDQVIYDQVGAYVSDVEFAEIAWSNELVLHVIELKTNGPAANLQKLPALFQEHILRINEILKPHGACLLPGGMHPLMNPYTETRLWPHEYNAVYEAYNKIFDCRGHGWANLQSTHLNLPFANEEEFGRLHAAIRLLLPLIPALSAASPIMDGQVTPYACTRLQVYAQNQQQIPPIAGQIIPEPVFSYAAYQREILEPAYRAIGPFDPEGILQDEFLNSRAAIARFERQAIEIRLIDNQETPLADVAILQFIVWVLQLLIQQKWTTYKEQQSWSETDLAAIYREIVTQGLSTPIAHPAYLGMFGYTKPEPASAREVWQYLLEQVKATFQVPANILETLNLILQEGNLTDRIRRAVGENPKPEKIKDVYFKLADCLATGKLFRP